MIKLINLISVSITIVVFSLCLNGCGFHLRGKNHDYNLPFNYVYLDCKNVNICSNLKSAIKTQGLTQIVNAPTPTKEQISSNNGKIPNVTTILLLNEQTSRDPQNFNSVGRISAYLLTYQIQAQIWQDGVQIGDTLEIQTQSVMQYNDSIILANNIDEAKFWDNLHENATNQLIRKLVAFKTTDSTPK